LKCDSNTYSVQAGKPSWQLGKDTYHSLTDWQHATGQDANSKYGEYTGIIPSWHKYPEQAIHFRKTKRKIQQGAKAPEFSAYTFVKQKVNIPDRERNIVLLSFINGLDSLANDELFSQLAFLKSMKRQYTDPRLKIILVAESPFSNESFVNFINDNELENITMIQDNNKANIG